MRGRTAWAIAAAAAPLLVAIAAGAYALVGGDDDSSPRANADDAMTTAGKPGGSAASTTQQSSMGNDSGGGMTSTAEGGAMGDMGKLAGSPKEAPSRLGAFVASHDTWSCGDAMKAVMGASKSVVCRTKVPEHLTISVFPSKTALHRAYDMTRMADHAPAAGTGRCAAASWAGESVWLHGEGEPGGRVYCFLQTAAGHTKLVWASDLGTPALFQAQYDSLDHRTLFFWWVNTRHELI
jgi:hypothetical protein